MINIEEIYNNIITDLGQNSYVENSVFELDIAKCLRLTKSVLGLYSRYIPHSGRTIALVINGKYEFLSEPPQFISRVYPTSNSVINIGGVFGRFISAPGTTATPFIWKYNSPVLYAQYDGEVEILCVWNHSIKTTVTGTTPHQITTYTIETINDTDYLFYELLKSRMMQSIGRNRKAFTLNDIPITSDADSMVSDGKEMETTIIQQIQEQSSSFLAWG